MAAVDRLYSASFMLGFVCFPILTAVQGRDCVGDRLVCGSVDSLFVCFGLKASKLGHRPDPARRLFIVNEISTQIVGADLRPRYRLQNLRLRGQMIA
jgi:hypothetical protein